MFFYMKFTNCNKNIIFMHKKRDATPQKEVVAKSGVFYFLRGVTYILI